MYRLHMIVGTQKKKRKSTYTAMLLLRTTDDSECAHVLATLHFWCIFVECYVLDMNWYLQMLIPVSNLISDAQGFWFLVRADKIVSAGIEPILGSERRRHHGGNTEKLFAIWHYFRTSPGTTYCKRGIHKLWIKGHFWDDKNWTLNNTTSFLFLDPDATDALALSQLLSSILEQYCSVPHVTQESLSATQHNKHFWSITCPV